MEFAERIASRSAKVAVVGLGYVGLPFAVEKAKAGFMVYGIDRSQQRVDHVNAGDSYIGDVEAEELKVLVKAGKLKAVTDFDILKEVNAVVVAVPTPLDKNLTPDLQYVIAVTKEIAKHLQKGQLISLESTTYPGTTEEIMLPLLEQGGLKVEEDFFLVHSPERVDPGNIRYSTKNTNKIVGGYGPKSLEAGLAFYSATLDHVVPVSSARAAEMVKVFENTFRAVNIALVNELLLLSDRMNLNIWEVLEAANTKPFGIMRFMPGPGVGGHCIPLDPHYLEWKAREYNMVTRFIALAGEINRKMPEFVVAKAGRILNKKGKSLKGAKILALGVAYKRDIDDWRESPSIEVMQLLQLAGAELSYHDAYVPEVTIEDTIYSSQALTPEAITGADLIVILTDHTNVDYQALADNGSLVLDTRNATKSVDDKSKVIVLL